MINLLAILLGICILGLIGINFFLLFLIKRILLIQKANSLHDLESYDTSYNHNNNYEESIPITDGEI